MRIIEWFKQTDMRDVIDCRITSMRDVLRYYGVKIDSFTLFLMLDVIDFRFGEVLFNPGSKITIWIAGASVERIENNILSNLNTGWQQLELKSDCSMDAFAKYIDQEIPIGIVFDSSYLLKKHEEAAKATYKLTNLSFTALVGYDKEKAEVYLDLKNEYNSELHTASFEDFQTSRATICYPESPNEICYEMILPDTYKDWFEENRYELIRKGILNTCKKMLEGQFFERTVETYTTGVRAIKHLSEALSQLEKSVCDKEVSEEIANRVFLLKTRTVRDVLLPGSNTCYRNEFGSGLVEFSKQYKNKRIKEIGEAFIKLGKQWRNFVRHLSAAEKYLKKKDRFIDKAITMLDSIYKNEQAFYLELEQLLNK